MLILLGCGFTALGRTASQVNSFLPVAYLRHYGHCGYVWQGRLKAFPIQKDEHLLTVVRYIERNPLRAGLVARAEDWRWSSLRLETEGLILDPGPAPRGPDWVQFVNTPMTEAEVAAIPLPVRRDRPYGTDSGMTETVHRLGLEYSARPRGRQPRLASLQKEASGSLPRSRI